MKGKRGKRVAIQGAEQGPIGQLSLPLALIRRIETIARILADVDPRPLRKWIRYFERNENPEMEVALWEVVASAYFTFTRDRRLSKQAKREAHGLLEMCSMMEEPSAVQEAYLRRLSQAETSALVAAYTGAARNHMIAQAQKETALA